MDAGFTAISRQGRYCHSLRIVKLPDTVVTLGCAVFQGCCSLQVAELPGCEFGVRVFAECCALESVGNIVDGGYHLAIGAIISCWFRPDEVKAVSPFARQLQSTYSDLSRVDLDLQRGRVWLLPTSARVAQEPLIGIQYSMLCSRFGGTWQIGTTSIREDHLIASGPRFRPVPCLAQ